MREDNERDWLDTFLTYTDNSEPPQLYKEWVGLSVIAACLQRKCWIDWGFGPWYPNLFLVLVGPSGRCRKGTIMRIGKTMLEEKDVELAPNATTKQALARRLERCAQTNKMTDDEVLVHSSLTVFSEELTVFLGYNNPDFVQDITDLFDCANTWVYETKTQGTNVINNVWLNLIGATTPSLVQRALPQESIGGGFTSRVIFVYASDKGKLVPIPFLTEEEHELYEWLLDDMDRLLKFRGQFSIAQSVLDKYVPWYMDHDENPPFDHPQLASYNSRRGRHLIVTCMLMSASRSDEMIIRDVDWERALDLLRRTEARMPLVFGGYGKSDNGRLLDGILRLAVRRGGVTKKQILEYFYAEFSSIDELTQGLRVMEQGGRVKVKVNGQSTLVVPNWQSEDVQRLVEAAENIERPQLPESTINEDQDE